MAPLRCLSPPHHRHKGGIRVWGQRLSQHPQSSWGLEPLQRPENNMITGQRSGTHKLRDTNMP